MKSEYRFNVAAILVASVLTVLGMSAAQAGGRPDSHMPMGDVRSRSGVEASLALPLGGVGVNGGDLRSRDAGVPARGVAKRGTALAWVCYPPPTSDMGGPWLCKPR